MPYPTIIQYPDILGYLTGGPRCNVSVAQLALATRPRVVRAGHPFEAILMIQNACDADIDITATLQLPQRDAKGQKDCFKSKACRLVIGLRPAEVGYLQLPVMCAASTATHEGYKLGVTVQVKPLSKPLRVRPADDDGDLGGIDLMPDDEISELQNLAFSVEKSFGLGTVLETTFSVLPGKIGRLAHLSPGWVSLWIMPEPVEEATPEVDWNLIQFDD